jgi:hypothetical protein
MDMTKKSSAVRKAIKMGEQKDAKKQTRKQTGKTSPRVSKERPNKLLAQARDLQWARQQLKAIEVCTQALDAIGKGNSRTIQIRMDLFKTRAESHVALINLDAVK